MKKKLKFAQYYNADILRIPTSLLQKCRENDNFDQVDAMIIAHIMQWCQYHNTDVLVQTYEQFEEAIGVKRLALMRRITKMQNHFGLIEKVEKRTSGNRIAYRVKYNTLLEFMGVNDGTVQNEQSVNNGLFKTNSQAVQDEQSGLFTTNSLTVQDEQSQLSPIDHQVFITNSITTSSEDDFVKQTEPNLDPTKWGMSINRIREWVEILILPEYQETEYTELRQVAGYSLVDIINMNNLSFDDFIVRAYPSLNRWNETTLRNKLKEHLNNKN